MVDCELINMLLLCILAASFNKMYLKRECCFDLNSAVSRSLLCVCTITSLYFDQVIIISVCAVEETF